MSIEASIAYDYYRLLGVSKDASTEKIKRAYRQLAMQHHPDRNNGDPAAEERLKEINQAYQIVGNAVNRRQYDLHCHLTESPIWHGPMAGDANVNMRRNMFGGCGGFGLKEWVAVVGPAISINFNGGYYMAYIPEVDAEKCVGCGACIDICPVEVYELQEEKSG